MNKRFLPVIHVESFRQTYHNTQLALDAGADGVFIINHGSSAESLIDVADRLLNKLPLLWLGVNCLGRKADEILRIIPTDVKGLWSDGNNDKVRDVKALLHSGIEYFGGVAFKYQRPVKDYAEAAKLATAYMDVVTTSGPGTGVAAPISKIMAMKKSIGSHRLGIASGITPLNIIDYLPYVDDFLVATGISLDFHNLDFDKTQQVADSIHGYK